MHVHDPGDIAPVFEILRRVGECIGVLKVERCMIVEGVARRDSQRPRGPAQPVAQVLDRPAGQLTPADYAAAGGQILFGTDVGYTDAFDTREEYRLMSAAIDWRNILRSLTTAPAERFGYAARKGRVAQGMDADLVVLDADPAQDPTAFAKVRATIRGGRMIWSSDQR